MRDDSPLHKVTWLRIVLDEGHTIRNPNAQQTKAALNLDGHRRWVLTGKIFDTRGNAVQIVLCLPLDVSTSDFSGKCLG